MSNGKLVRKTSYCISVQQELAIVPLGDSLVVIQFSVAAHLARGFSGGTPVPLFKLTRYLFPGVSSDGVKRAILKESLREMKRRDQR